MVDLKISLEPSKQKYAHRLSIQITAKSKALIDELKKKGLSPSELFDRFMQQLQTTI